MRINNKNWRVGLAIVALSLMGAVAQADTGNGNPNDTGNGGNGNHNGWGEGNVPAAPEPMVIAMVSMGFILVGGYVTFRLRRRAGAAACQAA